MFSNFLGSTIIDFQDTATTAQIDSKGYLIPYSVTKDKNGNDKRRVKVGVSFDSEKRTLGEWKIVE